MAMFEIRTNCEYVLQLEAATAEEALKEAEKITMDKWDESWAEWEAEELKEREQTGLDDEPPEGGRVDVEEASSPGTMSRRHNGPNLSQ